MKIRIQMIGTGNQFAKKYFNNNALVYTDTYTFLIDCGMTGPLALAKSGKSFADIDGIIITHLHADHIGGLEEAAFAGKFIFQRKPLLYIPETLITPIWEHSLKAGPEEPEYGHGLDSYFEVVPLKEGPAIFVCPELAIKIIPTLHVKSKISYSLLLNDSLFYSADMQFDPKLMNDLVYSRDCRHILHDCQLSGPPTVHATLTQLLTLPDHIQQKIYLMHYGDQMEDFEGQSGAMRFLQQGAIYTFD